MNRRNYAFGFFSGMLLLSLAMCLWTHFADWLAVPTVFSALGVIFTSLRVFVDW